MLLLVLASEPKKREEVILPLIVHTKLDSPVDIDDKAALFKRKIWGIHGDVKPGPSVDEGRD